MQVNKVVQPKIILKTGWNGLDDFLSVISMNGINIVGVRDSSDQPDF